jgi:hypothetical protein
VPSADSSAISRLLRARKYLYNLVWQSSFSLQKPICVGRFNQEQNLTYVYGRRAGTTMDYLLCGNPLSERRLRPHFHPWADNGQLTTQRIDGIRKGLAFSCCNKHESTFVRILIAKLAVSTAEAQDSTRNDETLKFPRHVRSPKLGHVATFNLVLSSCALQLCNVAVTDRKAFLSLFCLRDRAWHAVMVWGQIRRLLALNHSF